MEKFTLKDYKDNKSQIIDLVNLMPPVFKTIATKYALPGFRLINEGLTHYKNEPVDPCRDYYLTHLDFEKLDLLEVFKKDFMDRGMQGLKERVDHIRVMHTMQKSKYPHLFKESTNETN